jgi:4-hydroxy-tetrahydrodipicolinate synthase
VSRELSTLVCAVTPFDQFGDLDSGAVVGLMDRFADAGIGTYIGGSSPGEGYALSLAETEHLFGVAKQAMAGRQPLRAMGIEPHNADELILRIRIAESVGLDGVQLYSLDSGHGNIPSPAELEGYFRRLAESTALPLYLSSHMASGYLIPLDVLQRLLADYPHILGLNVTTPDLGYLSRVIDLAHDRADVHVGGPVQALTAFALGAQGFLSADGNIAPRLCGSVVAHQQAGELDAAQAAYNRLIRLFRINAWGGSMRWLKSAMHVLGLPGYHLREPFLALSEADREKIRLALDELGIAESEGLSAVPGSAHPFEVSR